VLVDGKSVSCQKLGDGGQHRFIVGDDEYKLLVDVPLLQKGECECSLFRDSAVVQKYVTFPLKSTLIYKVMWTGGLFALVAICIGAIIVLRLPPIWSAFGGLAVIFVYFASTSPSGLGYRLVEASNKMTTSRLLKNGWFVTMSASRTWRV
jgi:hypothetical protein